LEAIHNAANRKYLGGIGISCAHHGLDGRLTMWSHSFNSRARPSEMEAVVAMKVHDSSILDRYATMKNPLANGGVNLIEAGGN